MIGIRYSPDFIQLFKKIVRAQQLEIKERIEEFKNPRNHKALRVHKLKGRMNGLWAFSVNYRDRIVFEWGKGKKVVGLLDFGDHSIYE